jgi:thymidylate kinase
MVERAAGPMDGAGASAIAIAIAIVGAESTGKTTLAQALCEALQARSGRRVAWVPEVLRGWCERAGRTPLAHEQASILRMQHEQIAAATPWSAIPRR